MRLHFVISVLLFYSLEVLSQEAGLQNKFGQLETIVGEWVVNVDTRISANGPWESSAGNSIITKVVKGTVIEEDFKGTREGRPFITKTLLAVNNLSGKLQRVFMDSEHGGTLIDFEGEKEGENVVAFEKNWTYPNGNTVKLRVVYTMISKNEFSLVSMRMPQSTPFWDITGRMNYVRKE